MRCVFLVLLASLAWRTADGLAADRPNVVFVLLDDVRWDDLGATWPRE